MQPQRGAITLKQRYFVAACCIVEADSEEEAKEIADGCDVGWTIQSAYLIDYKTRLRPDQAPRPLQSSAPPLSEPPTRTNVPPRPAKVKGWQAIPALAGLIGANPAYIATTLLVPTSLLLS